MPQTHRFALLAATGCCLLAVSVCLAGDPDLPVDRSVAALAAATEPAANGAPDACHREALARTCYDLRPGEGLDLDVSLDLASTLTQAAGAPTALTVGIEGPLELRVLARRADELAIAACLPAVRVRGGEGSTPEARSHLAQDLGTTTVVRLSTQGAILGYRFPATMPAQHRNQFRALFAALRVPVGAPGQARWTACEADATGEAEVAGAWDPDEVTLSTHKSAYRSPPPPMAPQVDGRGRATLDRAAGWWQVVHYEETSTLAVAEAQLTVRVVATMHAELRRARTVPTDGLPAFDWNAPWAPASGTGDRDTEAADPEDLMLARELRGVSVATLVAQLRALLAAEAGDAELHEMRRRLVWLVRHDPLALLEFQGLLAEPGALPRLLGEVLSAVGAADTGPAQDFLAGLLGGEAAPAVRLAAAQALFQTAAPAATTLRAIRAMLAEGAAPRELHGTGLLLLGALANRDAGAGAPALQELLARGPFARDQGLLVDWLEALGNAGRPQVADAALPHFQAAEASERAAAVAAVRKVDDGRVLAALLDRAANDESAMVRCRAVEGLAGRAGGEVLPLLGRILGNDPDEQVRSSAVLAIAFRSERAAAQRLLAEVAGQDPSPHLRQLASDLLAQRRP